MSFWIESAHYSGVIGLSSVIDFERSFRKWRRANKFGWEVPAEWIRDSCLKPKFVSALPPLPGTTASGSQGNTSKQSKNRCRDFGRGSCTRLAGCTWSHQCSRCNTTWPTTSPKCLCVNGSKPPHISLPPWGGVWSVTLSCLSLCSPPAHMVGCIEGD